MEPHNPYQPPSSSLQPEHAETPGHGIDLYAAIVPIAAETPYPPEAFIFLLQGFEFAHTHIQNLADGQTPIDQTTGRPHLTGQELSWCLHDFAIRRFGDDARAMLESWNVLRTQDFGAIVDALTGADLMTASEDDRPQDFDDVFIFQEQFDFTEFEARILPEDEKPTTG